MRWCWGILIRGTQTVGSADIRDGGRLITVAQKMLGEGK